MTRKFSQLVFALLLLVLAGGCARTGDNNANKPSPVPRPTQHAALKPGDYFPLQAGSTWTYQGSGNEFASFERQVEYVKNDFAQVREANGGTISSSIYRFSDSAVTRVYSKGESYDSTNALENGFASNDNTVIIQAPLNKGSNWQNDDNIKREIVSLSASVATPAGTFKNCLHIKWYGSDYVTNEYYAKGVGLVKREFISGGQTISSTLEKYTLAGKASEKPTNGQ